MRVLPLDNPGTPDLRSPGRYLLWLGRQQLASILGGIVFGITWMLAQALTPVAIGRGVNAIGNKDHHGLWLWSGVVLGLGVILAVSGIIRHRFAVTNWMVASFRTIQLLGEHLADTATPVVAAIPTGDVVNTMASDATRIGGAYDVIARFAGAIVSYIVVAVIMLQTSVSLGLIVLIGVPLLVFGISPLIKPLQKRQMAVRDQAGKLTAIGADTVAGLRILRGIGGEQVFLDRYKDKSQAVRTAGIAAAIPQATLDTAQVALPAIFILIVTWVGARLTLDGSINAGQLVAFYGFAVFLVAPLRTATEFVEKVTRANVGARKVLAVLTISSPSRTANLVDPPPHGSELIDGPTGLTIPFGQLVGLCGTDPAASAHLAERLGAFAAPAATFGGVELTDLAMAEVRRRIVVSETEPRLFTGPLRTELDPTEEATDLDLAAALTVASAHDVIEALPLGLDEVVEERGRAFSGGQRQRLALARVLLAAKEVLILIEPTSAVDAHTEMAIAERLKAARTGRTTVVVTSSPLLLDRCDVVAYLEGETLVATGTHRELLNRDDYRATVLRGVE
ncbi:MAG: ABC transporter ATP-binding protein [Actinomycetota bacterium]